MAIADWSPTAANNSTVLGVNIAENCPAANMNNALRQAMADVAGGINFSILGSFLSSSSLSSARSALGVSGGSTSSNNFGNLTNVANKLPYMTGSDNWSTTDFPSYGRSLVAAGDAATARSLLGIASAGGLSNNASSGYASFDFAGTTFIIQWVDATATANSSTSVTYPTAYSSWSRAWCSGGDFSTSDGDNFCSVTSSSTTGATVKNGRSASSAITVFSVGV